MKRPFTFLPFKRNPPTSSFSSSSSISFISIEALSTPTQPNLTTTPNHQPNTFHSHTLNLPPSSLPPSSPT
ncbi:hypothetical protein E2C01_099968 [Portunus trituberculatus]|uniref:Uncharacterized protein n=1 Tax=Portunus trituberculatus TaxID=210409 RepID=A0A5B7KGR5_PORTR|nr:hypothetical protein [Portunus trituberculatus]